LRVLCGHPGDEGHDETGRTLDLVGIEQTQAIGSLVNEPLDEGEAIVLRVHPNVSKGRLTVGEPGKVGRLPVGPPAPGLLGIGDATIPWIRGERELVPVRQFPPDLLVGPSGNPGGRLARNSRGCRDLFSDADAVQGLSLRAGCQGK
jgi:hypothetical protein